MTDPRSPIELLGAILDEVEGLRRTDARSYLPAPLLAEARMALDETGLSGTATTCLLRSVDDLAGRTVAHAFEGDLKRGDVLLMMTDGTFIVLEAEGGDDYNEASISLVSWGSADLRDYLRPHDLVTAGLMTHQQQREVERQERLEKARRRLEQAAAIAKAAEAELARLQANPAGEAA